MQPPKNQLPLPSAPTILQLHWVADSARTVPRVTGLATARAWAAEDLAPEVAGSAEQLGWPLGGTAYPMVNHLSTWHS